MEGHWVLGVLLVIILIITIITLVKVFHIDDNCVRRYYRGYIGGRGGRQPIGSNIGSGNDGGNFDQGGSQQMGMGSYSG